MSHYPCLDKQYIQGFFHSNQANQCNNRKSHFNSEILNKYMQTQRNHNQKVSQILPKYNIFPKSYNQYNIYTTDYNIDRLQRLINVKNTKYQNANLLRQSSQQSQKNTDILFSKTNSQSVMETNKNDILKEQKKNRSNQKNYQIKSIQSLDKTNILPSNISKNKFNKVPSKYKIQSDSKMLNENLQRQIIENKLNDKSSHLNNYSVKYVKNDSQEIQIMQNMQSAVTIKKRGDNYQRNQNYYRQKQDHQSKQDYYKFKLENSIQGSMNSNDQKLLKMIQIDQQENQKPKCSENPRLKNRSTQNITQNRKKNQYLSNDCENLKSKLRFQEEPDEINTFNDHLKIKEQKSSKQIEQQKTLLVNFYLSQKTQNKSINNEVSGSKLEDNFFEFYGQQFENVKAERDYLRKHFIQHLQNKHASDLPYKQLISMRVDDQGRMLTLSKQPIPGFKHKIIQCIVQINRTRD